MKFTDILVTVVSLSAATVAAVVVMGLILAYVRDRRETKNLDKWTKKRVGKCDVCSFVGGCFPRCRLNRPMKPEQESPEPPAAFNEPDIKDIDGWEGWR